LSIAARAVVAWIVLGLVGLGGWAGDQYLPAADDGSVVVGIVQGNVPGTGLEALGPARTTTVNSLAETIALMAQVATGQAEQPDFVLWPESSTDLDPTADQTTARLLDVAVDLAGAPLFLGAPIRVGPDARHTTALWWDHGPQDGYDKRNLVPFGEWIPARGLFEPLFPQLALVGRQTIPGSGVGVVSGSLRDGRTVQVGVMICFEVGYDDTADDLILGDASRPGAQVVVVQTNNSSLTGSGQMAQQDAITRIRAMESRRDIAVATTNSLAGWITPAGDHAWQAELGRSAAASVRLPLRFGATPATAHRRAIEIALVAGPALVWGLVWLRQRRRGAPPATMGATRQEGARP
jgi:apolipoprotein N-acyltransferase